MSLPLSLVQGTTVGGHYIVGPLMNSGGFGAVYQGIDTSEGNRPCAIKETYDVTPAARRQALMEASILFTVRSQHLPEVYDAFEAGGRFYLVMQLIEGQNLLELLRSRVGGGLIGEQEPHRQSQGPCSEQEVLSWLLPIVDVLQELHSRHPAIIHRDIKPANILLTPKQIAVLVDFGLTKLYDPDRNTQTMVKAVSAGFSPVEQYIGKTSPRSDIYSMAATIYLLLTNRLPPAAMTRVGQDTLIAPRLLNPALSPKVERALLKALAVNADERYQSMDEFAQALKAPAFQAHADPTIALRPVQTTAKTPSISPAYKQTPPIHAYTGVAGQPPLQTPISAPYYNSMPSPAYVSAGSPGYVMAPPSIGTPVRALPGSFGQGCLWGIVQGVLAALLVLFLKQIAYFYLAMLMGFGFYVIAGFMTTRRGGPSFRGAWAGFWAGIDSTITFWVALLIGLIFRVMPLLQKETTFVREHGGRGTAGMLMFSRAWRAVLPDFLLHSSSSPQQSSINLWFLLLGGLLVAFALGWAGGLLGRSRHKAVVTGKKRSW
jgi:serine/threonine protein kinase